MQMSDELRTDRASRIEQVIGTAPIIEIRTGSAPANCAASDTGTLIVQFTAASDWLADGDPGVVELSGSIGPTLASGGGTPGHYRMWDSGRSTCHLQGSCSGPTVGTGEMLVDADSVTAGQPVSITGLTMTEGNA